MTTTSAKLENLKVNQHTSIGLQVSNDSRQHNIPNIKQRKNRNTILKELPISAEDLTEEDITLYAKQIGIDPGSEPDLLWIARQGLISKLPFPWIAVEDQRGRLYYFNCETEQSIWEHPCDSYYRSLAEQQRLKGSSTTLSMSGLTSIANLHFVDEDMGFKSELNGKPIQSDKRSAQIDSKLNIKARNESNKNNKNGSDEEVESVDYELDVEEAIEELSLNDVLDNEELVTIDVTEGSYFDTNQFKEIHTIELNFSSDRVEKNELKYRIDDKSKADASLKTNSSELMKDKKQNSSVSSSNQHVHISNIKQSTGSGSGNIGSTGSKQQTAKHNEVSSDEFLLDVSEDPFAEFDGYDRNYNDLFGSLGTGMPSKYDNSNNYEQTSDKPLSANNQSIAQNTHKTHKPLETLEEAEERDENGLDSSGAHDISIGEDEELVVDEGEGEADPNDEEHNGNDNNIYEVNDESNGLQIESKFEEITNSLTEKITSLRNELREEIRKQRYSLNKEVNQQMNGLTDRVNRNSEALSDTKSEVKDLRQIITKNVSQSHTSATSAETVTKKTADIDKLEKEIQLLRSDVKNESIESFSELRNELNRDIKTRVNSVFGDLEMKFIDFKDESNREMRAVRNELANVSKNGINFGQQTTQLKDDLSQTMADIEKQRKEYNKRLERMDINLSEETQRFQSEVQRLQTLMKKIENKVQELDSESNKIKFMSRMEENEVKTSECYVRIDSIDRQVKDLAQQVLQVFRVSDQKNKTDSNDDKHKNLVIDEPKHTVVVEREIGSERTQQSGATDDKSQPINIYNRMSTMEESIKKICDSIQQMIPIINRNVSQNRNTYYSRKRQETTKTKQKTPKNHYSDEEEYMSRTSSSLLSSSSVSEPKNIRSETGKRRQMHKRALHYSMHNRSIPNKTDIHSFRSHKCCIHKDSDYHSDRNYQIIKVPLMPTTAHHWDQQQSHQLKHIRTSSSSLLNLIKKTTQKLREEAIELEGLGNYRFVTEFEPTLFKDVTNGADGDETAIKKLKSVRLDVDQKLRKLTSVINQQKSSQI